MPTVELLTECVPPIAPTASVPEVFNWFQAHPDAMALPVVEDGRPVGLIDRQSFLQKLASPLGQSRYASRPVSWIMDSDPAVIEADMRIEAFSNSILKSSSSTLVRGFIVTRAGQYYGIGTAIKLFHHVNLMQAERIKAYEAEIAELKTHQINHEAVADARNRFVDNLTQALSAPLSTVGALAENLSRQALPIGVMTNVEAIIQASQESLGLMNSARDVAHAEAGHFDIDQQPCALRTLMGEITAHWTERAKATGNTLMVSYEGDTELNVLIDAKRFRATYDTMIESALQWSRNGMVEVGLKAEAGDAGVALTARVRDDGQGLEPDELAKAFGDLETTGRFANAMAWHLLRSLGGRIFARNNTGRGTTYGFDVVVPIAEHQAVEEVNVTHLEGLELTSRPHVLIADDNATNRVVARALCEMFGCTSETADDGQEALDAAKTGHFDLILMDIKMPRMDGIQATLAIRALGEKHANTPIIALTANADPDDVAGYIEAGMAGVVEKPIKPERMRMAMIRALETRSGQTNQNEAPAKASLAG